MRHEIELAYLGLEVSEPDSLTSFFGDVIGLVPGEPCARDTLVWRDDDRRYRLLVSPGTANDAVFIGLEVSGDAAFESASTRLRNAGFPVEDGPEEDRALRCVERLVRTKSPWGVDVELAVGLQAASSAFDSPLMPGGFLTSGVGFGHVVFATTAFDQSHRFLVDGLGFEQSDWLEIELAPELTLEVRFYHCNERHHTIALAKAPFDLPQSLHHVMFETQSRDDVGAAFERAWEAGLPIPNGLGRHDNDGMFSFYVASPTGFQVEIGHGARVITDDWDDNRRYDQISAWGHQPLQRP